MLCCVVKSKFVYSKKHTMIYLMQACENSQNCDNPVTRGQRRELKVKRQQKENPHETQILFDKDIFPSVYISNHCLDTSDARSDPGPGP